LSIHKTILTPPHIFDKVYQLLAHGRWFSPGTPASSTTKTGRHDIAEILLNIFEPVPSQEPLSMVVIVSFFFVHYLLTWNTEMFHSSSLQGLFRACRIVRASVCSLLKAVCWHFIFIFTFLSKYIYNMLFVSKPLTIRC